MNLRSDAPVTGGIDDMSKQLRTIGFALSLGIVAMLLLMPISNPCLLNFDRSARPLELAGPNDSPFGMIACDTFDSVLPGWSAALAFVVLLCSLGAVVGRAAAIRKVLLGGIAASTVLLLAFAAGKIIYPWLEAYWMPAKDLSLAIPIAFLFGAVGAWLGTRRLRGPGTDH
jgi:hypothetical protein